jgi:tetratricopeptide (TPR) repeat protein
MSAIHDDTPNSPGLRPDVEVIPQDDSGRLIENEVLARLFGAAQVDSPGTQGSPSSARIAGRGTALGRYVLLDRLGAGGMGIVHSAYDPELDRKVAIKLLLPGKHGSESGRARLLREAQALAKLTHPNVVTVHDVGTHEDQVWIAMEFVPGQTLGAWAKQRVRRWPELLRVLIDVVRGVAAAHAVGLVHRDLKPDNVMIGRDGRVLVMDFGLAHGRTLAVAEQEFVAGATVSASLPERVLAPTLPEDPRLQPEYAALAARLTQAGSIQGTPAYMAPEQWRGEEATAAADQFGWSVMAWELLYGERPFRGENLLALAASVLGGRRGPPPKSRGVPAWLRRLMERALSPEASQRWPTMAALLAELERGRTLARARVATAAVVGMAVVGAAWVGYQRFDTDRRIDACVAEGDAITAVWNEEARTRLSEGLLATGVPYAAITAERIVPYVQAQADAWREARTEACLDARVRSTWDEETLERSVWCLDERKMELETLIAEYSHADATSAEMAVMAAAELPQVNPCRDSHRLARQPPLPQDRASVRRVLGLLSEVWVLRSAGKFEKALALAREARAVADTLGWPPLAAATDWHVGDVLVSSGQYQEAEESLEQAYFQALDAGAWEVAADAAVSLIRVVGYLQARYDEGLRWSRHAAAMLSILEAEPDSLTRVIYFMHVASLYSVTGKSEEAKASHHQALEIVERTLGPSHPSVGSALNNIAMLHIAARTYGEAKVLLERSVAISEETVGPDHPKYAIPLDNLGHVYRNLGAHERAKSMHLRARAVMEKTLGPDHPDVAQSLNNLALVYGDTGEHEAATELYRQALAIYEKTLGPDHPDVAQSLNNLALVVRTMGRHEEAKGLHERALAIWEKKLGPDHPMLSAPLNNLSLAHFALGAYDEARALNERVLAILEKKLGPDDAELAYCLTSLANIALAQRRPTDAVKFAERAVRLREAGDAPAGRLAESQSMLARGLWDAPAGQGRDRSRALVVARQAREGFPATKAWEKPLATIDAFLTKNGGDISKR